MADNLKIGCARTGQEHLLTQWHPEKNRPLTPEGVAFASHKMVWWVCERGHEWKAQIRSRGLGANCPVCTNRTVQTGENDLAALYPELADQWHPSLNGALSPKQIVPGSKKKVWWMCERGHEWQAQIASRTIGGKGCPYCAGKQIWPGFNDLASQYPELAHQWHPTLNEGLTPDKVTAYSNRRVWWVCEHGHHYQAIVNHRSSSGSGCPYCAGRRVWPGFNDLATLYPKVAEQWHPTLNGEFSPEQVTAGSHRKIWWECGNGHVWNTAVYSRTGNQQSGCPVCAGKASAKCRERSDRAMEITL